MTAYTRCGSNPPTEARPGPRRSTAFMCQRKNREDDCGVPRRRQKLALRLRWPLCSSEADWLAARGPGARNFADDHAHVLRKVGKQHAAGGHQKTRDHGVLDQVLPLPLPPNLKTNGQSV